MLPQKNLAMHRNHPHRKTRTQTVPDPTTKPLTQHTHFTLLNTMTTAEALASAQTALEAGPLAQTPTPRSDNPCRPVTDSRYQAAPNRSRDPAQPCPKRPARPETHQNLIHNH
jgi:hypothetical protein